MIEPQRIDDAGLRAFAERMRNPSQRLADFRAQRAANLLGARRFARADRAPWARAGRGGDDRDARLHRAPHPQRHRGDRRRDVRGRGRARGRGRHHRSPSASRSRSRATGCGWTSRARPSRSSGNLNCPLPVTRAATLFAVRVLLDPDAPPSAGAHRPIAIEAPAGCVLNARPGAAVAAGNVETSSRVADLVLAALGRRGRRPGPGSGHDEQRDARRGDRRERVHLLRDPRRRAGSVRRSARPERRPRGDVEHAEHAGRGARARAAGAGAPARPAPRQRRRRDGSRAATGSSASSRRSSR